MMKLYCLPKLFEESQNSFQTDKTSDSTNP